MARRYVERNALLANLVTRAEAWRWSSPWRRVNGEAAAGLPLSVWPVPESADWLALINRPQAATEKATLRRSIAKGRPYGSATFEAWTVEQLGLSATLRDRGRPAPSPMRMDS